jgi:LysR family hydrogen peroxide-inducible transcriptional activator
MRQLRYFAKVAELENVTRAAEACFVSQPSLSQQIAKLERELGQPLFERLGRGVKLTEAGRQFKLYADQILALAHDAKAQVTDDPDAGRLVVAAIPTVAPYYLPGVLTRFTAECPKAQIEVVEETTEHVLTLLAAGEADLGILALPVQADHLQTEKLFTEELLAALPANHPLAGKPRLALRDVAQVPFVLLNEAHCLTNTAMTFCNRGGVAPIVTARIHQLATVLELVRLGHGVSLVPAMAVGESPGLVFRPLSGDKPSRTLGVAWNELRFQTKLFKRFVGYLRTLGDKGRAGPRGGPGPWAPCRTSRRRYAPPASPLCPAGGSPTCRGSTRSS